MNTNQINPRYAAFLALHKIEYENSYVNIELKETLLKNRFSSADKRLISNIIYGCVRYKIRLDYVISLFSSVKIKKISDKVLLILRMGIYQMMFLERIPASAAVNESVKICAKVAYKSKAFVNALLRKASNEIGNITYPKEDFLSVYYSYPKELTDFFAAEFKENCENVLKALNCESKISIRANLNKTTVNDLKNLLEMRGIKSEDAPLSNALFISGADITNLDLYKDGYFTVQGLSSMLAVDAMKIKKGMCVFDMCAAPGGKSAYIAEKTGTGGEVFSFDIHEHKVRLINKNAQRMGLSNIKAFLKNSAEYDGNLLNRADAVLADVPCAGLGIISKKPDIKYSYSKEGQKELAKLQLEILKNCSKYVKKGGTLVYSTCSMGSTENINNIKEFLKNSDFECESISDCLPDDLKSETSGKGYINILPHNGFDGFFICRMVKK